MPIYEYQCPECSNIFEEWAKASEMKEMAPCPLCQTPSEHIISNTAFVLKGGGWYVTDYGYRKNISEDSANAGAAGSAAAVPATAANPATGTAPTDSSSADAPKTDSSAAPAAPTPASPAPSAQSTAAPTTGTNTSA